MDEAEGATIVWAQVAVAKAAAAPSAAVLLLRRFTWTQPPSMPKEPSRASGAVTVRARRDVT
jgi:hypothetical protein